MAWERRVLILPAMVAGEDFSVGGALAALGYQQSGQFLWVKVGGEGNVDETVYHCNSHRDRMLGVMQGNPPLGSAADVMVLGVTKLVAGAALVAGQAVGTNNSGQAVAKNETSTGADYGDFVGGVVLAGANAQGVLATVLLCSPYRI